MGALFAKCCCCCCRNQADVAPDDTPKEVEVATRRRKCTDVLCLLLFAVFWFGMITIFILGLEKGEPERLVYGRDYTGKTCGTTGAGNCTDAACKFTYYPRLSQDLVVAFKSGKTNPLDIPLTGVCLRGCPKRGTVVCLYDVTTPPTAAELRSDCNNFLPSALLPKKCSQCWVVDMETESVLYRCLWKIEQDRTVVERCTSPNSTTDRNDPQYIDPNSRECATKETTTTTRQEGPANDNALVEQMGAFGAVAGVLMGDVSKARWVILACGGGGAMLVGFLYIAFMRKFAGCVIWTILLSLLLLSVTFTLYCFVRAGKLSLDDSITNVTSSVSFSLPSQFDTSNSGGKAWEWGSYIMTGISLAILLAVLFLRKRIRIAIGIIKEAGSAIQAMRCLMFFPVLIVLVIVVLLVYWLYAASYIASIDSLSWDDVKNAPGFIPVTIGNASLNATQPSSVESDNVVKSLVAFHFFGLLWTNAFLQGIGTVTIAGAVGHWYFTRPDADTHKKSIGRFPIAASLRRTLRYHLGSIAFGSLLIAIVQFIRAVLAYVDRQTKAWQQGNVVVRILFKVVQIYLWCFEKCLKFLTRMAYVVIAVEGRSFCGGARVAFGLIMGNLATIGVVKALATIVLVFGKVMVTVLAMSMAVGWFVNDDQFKKGGDNELSGMSVPLLLVAVTAYMVASLFMGVYEMTMDTLLVCFCLDSDKHKSHPSHLYAPSSLRKALGISGAVPTTGGASASSGKHQDAAPVGAGSDEIM